MNYCTSLLVKNNYILVDIIYRYRKKLLNILVNVPLFFNSKSNNSFIKFTDI